MIGLTTAVGLLKSGARVTVIERATVGSESSWAGGGILSPLCPWDYPAEVTQLASYSAKLYPEFTSVLRSETGIDSEYEISGMLVLNPQEYSKAYGWCASHGLEVSKCDASKFMTEINGSALFLPEIAQVRNPKLMQALRKQTELLGGKIEENCDVLSIQSNAGLVSEVITSKRKFYAEHYIVTAGAWSKQVLGWHALGLDIKPVRGQMLLFKFSTPHLLNIVLQDGLYLIPRRDGHLLVGSTLEDVGFDKSTTIAARDMLRHRAEALLPALRGMPLIQHWAGLRPGSPHNIPTIGQHPRLKNLYINSGHFRYGVTMAPASAQILINEITGAKQPFDVSPYRAGWGVET